MAAATTQQDSTAARDKAVLEAARKRGLRVGRDVCLHQPPKPSCAPCAEVALRLAVDEIDDVLAEYAD